MAAGKQRTTVVVPAFNAESHLPRCLDALQQAGFPSDRIIVVDDASTDGTAACARGFGVQVLVRSERGGPAAARNTGIDAAATDFVLFVDADVTVTRSGVDLLLDTLAATPDAAAAFGSYCDAPPGGGLVSQYRNLLHHWVHQTGRRDASTFWSGFGVVRRSVLAQLGGYDAGAHLNYIEDIELGVRMRRAGHRILLVREALCSHHKHWTLWTMVRTDLRHRALPWAQLMLQERHLLNDLNTSTQQRWSVALTGVAGLLALAALTALLLGLPWAGPVVAALLTALCLVLALNLLFLRFLSRRHGLAFAAACFPLHLVHYGCAGTGFALAWLRRRPAPRTAVT